MKRRLLHLLIGLFIRHTKILILLIGFIISHSTYSQGTSCATSTALTINGACSSGSIADTTEDAPLISGCAGTFREEGWYTFDVTSGPQDINISANTANGNLFLQLIGSLTSCIGLSQNSCANSDTTDDSSQTETISVNLPNGTYYIKVVNVSSVAGPMTLNSICVSSPPANDDCPGTTISVNADMSCALNTSADTKGATESIPAILCNGSTGQADDDVWFQFTATSSDHDITVTPTTLNNAVVELLSAPCNGTSLACADATTGSDPETISATGLTPGNNYYVRVYSYGGSGDEGTFNICVKTPIVYCQPVTDSPEIVYIDSVEFVGTLNDVSNNSNGYSGGYQDHTGLSNIPRQVEGEGINVHVEGNVTGRIKAWVDWDMDGLFNVATEEVYDSNTEALLTADFGFIIPPGTTAGTYRIRIRNFKKWIGITSSYEWTYDFNACEDFNNGINPEYGEAEDYQFIVEPDCLSVIESVTEGETCGTGTVDLSVTGSTGTLGYRWYDSETGGSLLYDDTLATGDWTTPAISSTTSYWVTAYTASCESWERTEVVANYSPVPTLAVSPNITERYVCGENSVLELSASGDIDEINLIDEDFESGGLGVFQNVTLIDNGATINSISEWQPQTNTYVPGEQMWFPAISSGFGANTFAMSNSDVGAYTVEHALTTTSSYDTSNFLNLNLELRMYYSHNLPDGTGGANDYIAIEVSTDGSSWTNITPNIISDVGVGTRFEKLTYDLASYVDEPTISLRIRYYAAWADGVAVDDIRLYGDKDVTAVNWNTTPAFAVDLYLDASATNPYTGDQRAKVYAIPNLVQLESSSFDFTIDTTMANGCGIMSENFSVNNRSRIWNGSSSRWDQSTNWAPFGVPDNTSCIIIRTNGSGTPNPTLGIPTPPLPQYGYNLVVKPGGFLNIGTQRWLTITDKVTVDPGGLFYIEDSGSLIQINNVTNTGDIYMERSPKFNGSAVTNNEYVYWSTPVDAYDISEVSPNANSGQKWLWVPSVSGNGTGDHGDWSPATGNMTIGKGYIIAGLTGTPSNYPITGFPSVVLPSNTALFSGVPNNGTISYPLYHGGYTGADYTGNSGSTATNLDDNWNLVGNPYPSAISADDFISANAANIMDDNTAIAGTIWLWSHVTTGANSNPDPFYQNFQYNYNGNDYLEYNFMGSNPPGFNGYISAGQSFFVLADDSIDQGGANSITFNNSMRNDTYSNDNFLEANPQWNNTQSVNNGDKSRIWLDLITPSNEANTILLGYADGATDEFDKLYDGPELIGSGTSFYSILGEKNLSIQGLALPFDETDKIPIGFKINTGGNHYIALNSLDGIFSDESRDIFIEDLYEGIIHNLRISPYSFNADAGIHNNRFVLKFQGQALDISDFEENGEIDVRVFDKQLKITTLSKQIDSVIIYDLNGKLVHNSNNIQSHSILINLNQLSQAAYIVNFNTIDGYEMIKRFVID